MTQFKVGDIVECVDARSSQLKCGELYIVHKIDRCFLDVVNLAPSNGNRIYSGWSDDRFRLADNINKDISSDVDHLEILKEY